jgi:cytochrome c oxidase subunit 1
MHNTMWVPGHFHFYLLVGLLPMLIGFSLHVFRGRVPFNQEVEKSIFWIYTVSTITFCIAFLLGGWASVPRRWAQHLESWMPYNMLGTVAGTVVVLVTLFITVRVVRRLLAKEPDNHHAHVA